MNPFAENGNGIAFPVSILTAVEPEFDTISVFRDGARPGGPQFDFFSSVVRDDRTPERIFSQRIASCFRAEPVQ